MLVIQPVQFLQYGPDITNELIPVATSVNPNQGMQGSVVNVTVTGINFGFAGTWNFGTGIVTSNILNINSTTTTMTLTISATAPTGFHNLIVTGIAGSSTLVNAFTVFAIGVGDFYDYIFQFPDQGGFLRDPLIQQFAPSVLGSQPGVQLLIYNPVETLQPPRPASGNALVLPPQLAQSTVPLPGFWGMLTIQSSGPIPSLRTHPNLQILNDRTMMFRRVPSVLITKIDVSHINIVINIFGVYVTDGLVAPAGGQYVGPGDALGASFFTGYWGLRAFSFATIGNKAVQLRRSSDGAVLDIATVANGQLDNAAITAFKGTSTLKVVKFYDQTGNGYDVVPKNTASEQAFTQNILSGFGVYDNTANNQTRYTVPVAATILDNYSHCFFSVYKTTSVPANFQALVSISRNEICLIAGDGGSTNHAAVKNEANFDDFCYVTATDGVWHALVGVINQTTAHNSGIQSSFANADNAGTTTKDLAGAIGPLDVNDLSIYGDEGAGVGVNSNPLIGYAAESAWFAINPPGAPWTQAQATTLIANAKAFWSI